MKCQVDESRCAGCGLCAQLCPEVFEIDANGLARAMADRVLVEHQAACRSAADMCPTEAILIRREPAPLATE